MKVAVLIPDRGDRPRFLKNCLRMMAAQTLQPHITCVVSHAPNSPECDITERYRIGYEALKNQGVDVIALIENDDFYSPYYLETMVNAWEKAGKPDLLGTGYTIYYHLKLKSYFTMHHSTRASAMNTLIKADLNFDWCADNEPYTDMHLWKILKGVVIVPKKPISIGIKHGEGLTGGHMHVDRLHRYTKHGTDDSDFKYLQSVVDETSFNFYSKYYETLQS